MLFVFACNDVDVFFEYDKYHVINYHFYKHILEYVHLLISFCDGDLINRNNLYSNNHIPNYHYSQFLQSDMHLTVCCSYFLIIFVNIFNEFRHCFCFYRFTKTTTMNNYL